MSARTSNGWGIAITARATYLKPWYEGFAAAQPPGWTTHILLPEDTPHAHPSELTTPVYPNLHQHEIHVRKQERSNGTTPAATHFGRQFTWMPDRSMLRILRSLNLCGFIIHEFSPFTLAALLHARMRSLPVVNFSDVGRDNAEYFPLKTRLWHAFWSLAIDARMAGCPAARVPVSGRKLPAIDSFHAVDSSEFVPHPKPAQQPVTFVFSGQLIQRKGLDLWFRAANLLRTEVGDIFRLRVLGGGDEVWAKQSASQAGIEHLVEWCGFLQRDAMKEALGTADVFVLPSRFDSYAAVVHEAACLGLPLLVSQYAGAAEALVRKDVNGFIIDPQDSSAFSAQMKRLLDPELRHSFGVAARATGESFCARRRGRAVWEWITQQFSL